MAGEASLHNWRDELLRKHELLRKLEISNRKWSAATCGCCLYAKYLRSMQSPPLPKGTKLYSSMKKCCNGGQNLCNFGAGVICDKTFVVIYIYFKYEYFLT